VEKYQKERKKMKKNKKVNHLCITCEKHCRECFDGDTEVYQCDDYKKKVRAK
jgi:hypothetical protein